MQDHNQNKEEKANDHYEISDYEDDDDYECDEDEEMLIDQMLEKPIDIDNEKDECNFYTYEKIQIKRIFFASYFSLYIQRESFSF
jgi:hypothetical protein